MKDLKRLLLLLTLILSGVGCAVSEEIEGRVTTEPPNILLAIADDWSWPHAGLYGDSVVRTPTLTGWRVKASYLSMRTSPHHPVPPPELPS